MTTLKWECRCRISALIIFWNHKICIIIKKLNRFRSWKWKKKCVRMWRSTHFALSVHLRSARDFQCERAGKDPAISQLNLRKAVVSDYIILKKVLSDYQNAIILINTLFLIFSYLTKISLRFSITFFFRKIYVKF